MGFIAFIIFGLIVGLIARAIMPGRQSMGLFTTTLLGIAGACVGGLIGSLIGGYGVYDLHPAGVIGGVVGALIVLLLVGTRGGRRRAWT